MTANKGLLRVVAAAGAVLAMSGCSGISDWATDRRDATNAKVDSFLNPRARVYSADDLRPRVAVSDVSTTIRFAPNASRLTADQRVEIDAFLSRVGGTSGDRAVVSATGASAERRAAAVARHLAGHGIVTQRAMRGSGADEVSITLSRAVAVSPNCKEWDRLMRDNDVAEYNWRLGCLHAAGLAASVHRPRDLVEPRGLGPADGVVTGRGIDLHREGKFDPPITQDTSGSGSGQK